MFAHTRSQADDQATQKDPPDKDPCAAPSWGWSPASWWEGTKDAFGYADCPDEARDWARDGILDAAIDARQSLSRVDYSFVTGNDMRTYDSRYQLGYRESAGYRPRLIELNDLKIAYLQKIDEVYATLADSDGNTVWSAMKPVIAEFTTKAEKIHMDHAMSFPRRRF